MSKRMFQILDEMNVADSENNTANVALSNHLVSATTAKGGGHVTMGVEASYIHKLLMDDDCIPILMIINKKEYDKILNKP